jgi:two-component system, NtrC family, response regulator
MLRVTLSDLSRLPVERLARLLMECALKDQRLLARLHTTLEEAGPAEPASAAPTASEIIGHSAVIRRATELIGRFARTDDPVLLTG